jgi:phosphoglycolate phosphatase-like HAD superfamily hydrolase
MGLTLLSDFDGVWTDQGSEAEAILEVFEAELARLAATSIDDIRAGLSPVVERVRANPGDFGWAPDGRISAYVDEDPLLQTNAYAAAMVTLPEGERYRALAEAEFGSIRAFGDHCFVRGTQRHRELHDPSMVEGAHAAMSTLLDRGIRVVVVSNSSAQKVVPWLRSVGIDAGVDEGEVRVVGDARKWELGAGDQGIEVSGRFIHTDRPAYRAVIERVRPDAIIGDVFSLDLALPHVMRRSGDPAAPSRLMLRRHGHSPAWVVDGRAGGAIDHLVAHPSELAELLTVAA